MSDPQQHGPTGRIEASEEQGGELTRRTVLAGVAATTMAATVAGIDTPAAARSIDPEQPRDMVLFILLSAALTGIAEKKLSTGFRHRTKPAAEFAGFLKQLKPDDLPEVIPGNDPVDIKRDYFRFVQARYAPGLAYLLSITEGGLGASGSREGHHRQAHVRRRRQIKNADRGGRQVPRAQHCSDVVFGRVVRTERPAEGSKEPRTSRRISRSFPPKPTPRPGPFAWPRRTRWASARCSSATGTSSRTSEATSPAHSRKSLERLGYNGRHKQHADQSVGCRHRRLGLCRRPDRPRARQGQKQVLILEAGAGVPTNINDYMERFYSASAKVPESPYTPALFDAKGLSDPATRERRSADGAVAQSQRRVRRLDRPQAELSRFKPGRGRSPAPTIASPAEPRIGSAPASDSCRTISR